VSACNVVTADFLDVDLTFLNHNTRVMVSPFGCLNYPKPNIGLSNVIKGDLMQMFHDLHSGTLLLFRLNFGVIILIPNV
jgi:hypothetical protein